jgi:methylglutaconyl-CoA hydratase
MEYYRIKYAVEHRIGKITLSSPDKSNAIDNQMVIELTQAFMQAQKDTTVKVVILNAEGVSFCTGFDNLYLQQILKYDFNQNLLDSSYIMKLYHQIYSLRKPVIALIQGAALAVGCSLAIACDFIIAARETAKFGYTEVQTGFIPAIVLVFLVRRIGEGRTRELVLSGNILSADNALEIGLITQVVPAMELDIVGVQLANDLITNNSGSSMGLIKELFSRVHGMTTNDALDYAANLNALTHMTDDCKRGIEALLSNEIIKW